MSCLNNWYWVAQCMMFHKLKFMWKTRYHFTHSCTRYKLQRGLFCYMSYRPFACITTSCNKLLYVFILLPVCMYCQLFAKPSYTHVIFLQTYIELFKNIASINWAELIIAAVCVLVLALTKDCINDRFKKRMKMPVPIDLIVVCYLDLWITWLPRVSMVTR